MVSPAPDLLSSAQEPASPFPASPAVFSLRKNATNPLGARPTSREEVATGREELRVILAPKDARLSTSCTSSPVSKDGNPPTEKYHEARMPRFALWT